MSCINRIRDAAKRILPFIFETPLLENRDVNQELGCRLLLKAENFQVSNSFKIRGATNFVLHRQQQGEVAGLVAASSGNHGQAVARVASELGLPAIIVMPETAPDIKLAAVASQGAEIKLTGRTSEDRMAVAIETAETKGYILVPPFDHEDIVAGQGTLGLEIMAQAGPVDVVLVPVGGGGLLSGIVSAVKALSPGTRVIGVEPVGSNSMYISLQQGKPTRLDSTCSLADGLLSLQPGNLNYELVARFANGVVLVDEESIVSAMHTCINKYKVIAEPSGAAALAAAIQGSFAGMTVVVLLSGGNFDISMLPILE